MLLSPMKSATKAFTGSYLAVRHDDDGVGHRKGLLLVVRYVDEGDPGLPLHTLQLDLHVLAELEIEGAERLVEEQDVGLVDEGAGDGDALLLTAREAGHLALLEALHVHEGEHLGDALLYLGVGALCQSETEGDVLVDVEMRE